jgi:hypothetical protein
MPKEDFSETKLGFMIEENWERQTEEVESFIRQRGCANLGSPAEKLVRIGLEDEIRAVIGDWNVGIPCSGLRLPEQLIRK